MNYRKIKENSNIKPKVPMNNNNNNNNNKKDNS